MRSYLAITLVNIVLAQVLVLAAIISDDVDKQFEKFKVDFDRKYLSAADEQMRKLIFTENIKFIQEHNEMYEKGLVGHEVEVNQFTDMRPNELHTSLPLPKAGNMTMLDEVEVFATIPASFDWRKKNKVTSVKNQGHCGSCWSFASCAIIESAYLIHKNQRHDLSEQQMVDCLNTHCSGQSLDTALNYAHSTGLEELSAYPYHSGNGAAGKCANNGKRVHHKIASYGHFGKSTTGRPATDQQIQSAVMKYGPVAVIYEACGNDMMLYKGGVVTHDLAEKNDDAHWKCSHAVTIVGWGKEKNTDYWIVKNSWGANWGLKGYFKIQRGRDLRGINHWIYYVTL